MVSALGLLLGLDDKEEKSLRKILSTLKDDVPILITKMERLETLTIANAYFNREKDRELWAKCLKEAEQKVKDESKKMKTELRD